MDKPLTLTLHSHKANVEDKHLSCDFVPLQKAIDAATMRQKFEDLTEFDSVEWIKAHVAFVAPLFGVTPKQIMDGVDARELPDVVGIVNTILGIDPN